jgi:hypothetical protein
MGRQVRKVKDEKRHDDDDPMRGVFSRVLASLVFRLENITATAGDKPPHPGWFDRYRESGSCLVREMLLITPSWSMGLGWC